MAFPIRYFPETTKINFMKVKIPALVCSLLVIVATIGLIFTKGFNMGIDFTGGVVMEVRMSEKIDIAKMRGLLPTDAFGEVSLQYFGTEKDVMIRIPARQDANQAQVAEHVKQLLVKEFAAMEFRKIDYVGPTVGRELLTDGVLALVLSFVAMMLYVWFRFEWQYGVGGIFALLHDATMILLFYLVTGYEFSLTSIAAVLTIIGYSINDSVVIYDRIRENLRKYKQKSVEDVINLSVNETLSRTILTAGTTILSATALVVFGGEVLRGFSASLLWGLIIGTYSSIYISAPILIYFNLRNESGVADGAAKAA
jgi:preprotein translocase subunit SecF